MREAKDEDGEDIRAGLPDLAAVARLATTETAPEEEEFFWRNFLFILTALNRLGWGMAKGEQVADGTGAAGAAGA